MQYFPHRTPITGIAQAVSASIAMSASLISNFASIPIPTASVATNIVGSSGTPGTNYTKVGSVGSTGAQGDRGPRGDSLYILDVGWSTTTPSTCDPVAIGSYISETNACDLNVVPVTYYLVGGVFGDGEVIYYNSSCTTPVASLSNLAHGTAGAFNTDGSGVITTFGSCEQA